ncbi:MAG: alpha/beta fold hydrolase [Bacteriovoracaceae bacterium]
MVDDNYKENFNDLVIPHFQSGESRFFSYIDQNNEQSREQMHFHHFPNAKKSILVIVPGTSEPSSNYAELIYDLRTDYEIYILDLPGQGLSYTTDNQKINISDFETYTRNFRHFINNVVAFENNSQKDIFILAHSLGGLIAADYLSLNNQVIKKAILTAPMMRIKKSWHQELYDFIVIPRFAKTKTDQYASKWKEFNADPDLEMPGLGTSSSERWWSKRTFLLENLETTRGGPTWGWVHGMWKVTQKKALKKLKTDTPHLLFQAGDERYVGNAGQKYFCNKVNPDSCTFKQSEFEEARHAIFHESDEYRNKAIEILLDYFK